MQFVIAPDTTQQLDLQELLGTHLAFANDTSPPDDVHALDIEALGDTSVRLRPLARGLGLSRVSLETGTMDAFSSARRLYESLGFEVCEPFGAYTCSPNSVCMSTLLKSEITPS